MQTFPEWSDAENRLVERDYYSVAEVADLLHVHPSTVYRWMKTRDWPHLQVLSSAWFSAQDVGAIVASMRQGDGVPEANGEDGPALGWSVPADPWAREDGPADQAPGGVR